MLYARDTDFIYRDDMGVPTLMEWRNFYRLQKVFREGKLFYFTKWAEGEAPLILKLPSNIEEWKTKFFWLHADQDGRMLRGEFGDPHGFFFFFFIVFFQFITQTSSNI